MTDYDCDPNVLAWARAKVQEVVDKAEACAANTHLSDETREGWRQTASFIRHELVSRDGAAYAAFDERWPSLVNAVPAATEATVPGHWLLAGSRDLSIPEQHQFAAQPVDPEAERAATERAQRIAHEARLASEQLAALGGPHTGLVVQQYRNDQGEHRWVFRCWGDDHCDGLVSLDHTSQRWAEKARDRHLAEEHKIVPAPGPCPACRRADQAGLADSEQHPQCAGEQQPRAAVAPTRVPEIDRSLAARPGGDEGVVMPGPVLEGW